MICCGYENPLHSNHYEGKINRDIETKLKQTGLEKGADQNEFVVHASGAAQVLNMLPTES